jgi:hypothetical protein
MVAKLNTAVIYGGILTLENIGTAVNYCGIFIQLAPVERILFSFLEKKKKKLFFLKRNNQRAKF